MESNSIHNTSNSLYPPSPSLSLSSWTERSLLSWILIKDCSCSECSGAQGRSSHRPINAKVSDKNGDTQGFVCVARAAYSPPSCVLACYWSIVVCYWSISQSQTTTQLGGEKAALHKVQQHKRTLVDTGVSTKIFVQKWQIKQ